MIEFLGTKVGSAQDLIQSAIVLLAIVSIAAVAWRSRGQLAPILGMIVIAGLVIWATSDSGITWLRQKTEDESNSMAPAPAAHWSST